MARGGPVPSWTGEITRSNLSSSEKLVALVIETFLNRQTETAWPSLATLADRTGLHRVTVQRTVKKLEAKGWITREHRQRENGSAASTLYRLVVPNATGVDAEGIQGWMQGASGVDAERSPLNLGVEPTRSLTTHRGEPDGELRGEVFDTVALIWGVKNTKQLTVSARGRIAKAVTEILATGLPDEAIVEGWSYPEMVASFGRVWKRRWGDEVPCTPQSIARDWPRFCSGELTREADLAEEDRAQREEARRRLNQR